MEARFNALPDIDYRNRRFKPNAETYFFFRISILCRFFYGENHAKLFQKAQSGDVDAICRLLKIDKAIIQDRKISKAITKYSQDTKSDEFKKIARAFGETVKITSLKKLKSLQASMVSAFSNLLGANLTSTDIQYIYDLGHRAKTDGYAPDPDLPSPEAFAKTIQRKSPIYSNSLELDKK